MFCAHLCHFCVKQKKTTKPSLSNVRLSHCMSMTAYAAKMIHAYVGLLKCTGVYPSQSQLLTFESNKIMKFIPSAIHI